jgi:hypothetical protein
VPTEFIGPWPVGVPVQIHGMDADPFFVEEGDLEAARELASQVEGVHWVVGQSLRGRSVSIDGEVLIIHSSRRYQPVLIDCTTGSGNCW